MLWGLRHCGCEWGSGLPKKAAHLPVTRLWGDQGGEEWLLQATRHLHRTCYWKWNPEGPEYWRGWLPCSRLWAGGNLGSNPCAIASTWPQSHVFAQKATVQVAPEPRLAGCVVLLSSHPLHSLAPPKESLPSLILSIKCPGAIINLPPTQLWCVSPRL